MKRGAMSQVFGERVRERSVAMRPETASAARSGSHGAVGTAASGLRVPPPANQSTRKGANTTMSATRVVCATMIGSRCPP